MDEERSKKYDESTSGNPTHRQWEKLAAAVGEILTSIRGNDLGTKGLVDQVNELRQAQEEIITRLDKIEVKQQQIEFSEKIKSRYRNAIYALAGGLLVHFIESALQHFLK